MRVKKIAVKGLFGLFDHEIPVHSAERVTIIHGPNGFGKTVMLRMIAALAEGDPSIFETTPFSEFRLTLQDDTARVIRPTDGGPTADATAAPARAPSEAARGKGVLVRPLPQRSQLSTIP